MANLKSDLVEEDEVNNFHKDWRMENSNEVHLGLTAKRSENSALTSNCFICKSLLLEPFIRCAVCDQTELCLECFSKGKERNNHKNYHEYVIVRNEFPLTTSSNWAARDEVMLLHYILQCGYGNWMDIGCRIPKKSAEECQKHYFKHYIDDQYSLNLPKFKDDIFIRCFTETIPYQFKMIDVEEPPRFQPFTNNYKLLAGYNAARSDFQINFENHAELSICYLKDDDFEPDESCFKLASELKASIVQAYNLRLTERKKRSKITREHGLISMKKSNSCLRRFDYTISNNAVTRLKTFGRITSGIQWDYIIENLHQIGEIKNKLQKLFYFRKNGLKQFHSIRMFQELSKHRQDLWKYMKNCDYKLSYSSCVLPSQINVSNIPKSNVSSRRKASPLNINNMPDYEKLSSMEKELCSVVRLCPSFFIDLKHLLINENKKLGCLRLLQARSLLKIDVNKTRKIYDFLVSQGYINKPKN